MMNQRRGGIVATPWWALLICILSFDVLAGSKADLSEPEFRFRSGKGVERVVPPDNLWFHIYTEPSKTARYSVRAVYDPKNHKYVQFKEMSRFTVKKGPEGYVATFEMPDEPGTRTLSFDKSENFRGEEYVPAMLIKLRGR
ncbi:MAG: hypothetical protein V3T72_09435, partial [Thermoanaerobaculia bacterium]